MNKANQTTRQLQFHHFASRGQNEAAVLKLKNSSLTDVCNMMCVRMRTCLAALHSALLAGEAG